MYLRSTLAVPALAAACACLLSSTAQAQWQADAGSIYFDDGAVGIGTSQPATSGAALIVIPHPAFGAHSWGVYATTPPGGQGAFFAHTLDGAGIRGDSDSGSGIFGTTLTGSAVRATMLPSTGFGIALQANCNSPDGWSIYSGMGKNIFIDSIGVGTTNPLAKLHVTGSVGGKALDVNNQLHVNAAQNFVGIGRDYRIDTAEVFGIHAPTGLWGGMHIDTSASGQPFYGYSTGGLIRGYHYFNNAPGQWRLDVGGTRVVVNESNGNVGVGTHSPAYRLHVHGTAGKPGGGSWSSASDNRLKKNVAPLANPLERMLALRGVSYEYIAPDAIGELPGRHHGMIAQEVEAVFPDWVDDGPDGYKRLTFRGFEPLAVEALRELCARKEAAVKTLAEKNAALEARLAAQEKALSALASQLKTLSSRLGTDLAATALGRR